MIDINYSLRIAYYAALNGIAGVPVFYQALPPNVSPDNYIVFRSITNTDAGTKSSNETNTNITVEIHTWNDSLNNGLNADLVAREVYNRIYANPQFVLTLGGAQMVSTRLGNDVTQDAITINNRDYVSRFITFKHLIFQVSDIS